MNNFKFGLVWTIFFIFVTIAILSVTGFNTGLFLFFLLFIAAGVWVMYLGIKELQKNKKTNKYGEICYGIVTAIEPAKSNIEINGRTPFSVYVDVYVGSMNFVSNYSEEIGFEQYKYRVGECLKVKFYDNDINILEGNVDFNSLPYDIQNKFLPSTTRATNIPQGLYSGQEDTIIINGVEYKKMN